MLDASASTSSVSADSTSAPVTLPLAEFVEPVVQSSPAASPDVICPHDVGLWDNISNDLREQAVFNGVGCFQNYQTTYPETKRQYSQQNRLLQTHFFKQVLPNGEVIDREWMVYSPARASVFCFPCRLFSTDRGNQFAGKGFNDWKNADKLICQHEKNEKHREAVLTLCCRSGQLGRVDTGLHAQFLEQLSYWKNVLQRCAATIVFLCERGLPFRGSEEKVGSSSNGNYLGILELISQFDPFLSQHIKKHANRGSGHTSYLSKTICEEIIPLMGEKVMSRIKEEIGRSMYFSVSVDSTPDISHVDQLTIIIRYVDMVAFAPVERFLTFLPISSHTGDNLAKTLLGFLHDNGIDFDNCRGQSHDNASNMSGKYSGMQSRLKAVNHLVDYIPCASHSLNLVGQSAVDCCGEAVSFFGFLQKLYAFFVASTHRWSVLLESMEPGCKVPKHPSDTRWSARADATDALYRGYAQFQAALESIGADSNQKADTRVEANALAAAMDNLETSLLCEVWNDILQRFNLCSKALQSSAIELTPAIGLLKSLSTFLDECRGKFDHYERKAIERCGNDSYKADARRVRKRKRQIDDGQAEDVVDTMTPRQKFLVGTFYVIVDQLAAALEKRIAAYSAVLGRFGVLTEFASMSAQLIDNATNALAAAYPNDLSYDFSGEFQQFIRWFGEQKDMPDKSAGTAQKMFRLLHAAGVHAAFPNTEIAFRIYLCLMTTNCSGERSFSDLKRLKSANRSTMSQERLSSLSLMCIESELLRNIDLNDVIDSFAAAKARKTDVAGCGAMVLQ